jgi:hypothetical protein
LSGQACGLRISARSLETFLGSQVSTHGPPDLVSDLAHLVSCMNPSDLVELVNMIINMLNVQQIEQLEQMQDVPEFGD